MRIAGLSMSCIGSTSRLYSASFFVDGHARQKPACTVQEQWSCIPIGWLGRSPEMVHARLLSRGRLQQVMCLLCLSKHALRQIKML